MSRFEALFIKYLHCRMNLNKRDVSSYWTQRYVLKQPFNDKITVSGNFAHGRLLLDWAGGTLKEEWQHT